MVLSSGALNAATAVVRAITPWWEKKQKIAVLEADLATAITKFQLERQHLQEVVAEDRIRSMSAWYPLGIPGRLRSALRGVSQIVPRILIASTSGDAYGEEIRARMEDLLTDMDSSDQYLHLVTGAVIDNHDRAPLRGVLAHEVAQAEFDPAPSIVVVCEGPASSLRVVAHASHLFSTVEETATCLDLPLARLRDDVVQAAWTQDASGTLEHRWNAVDNDAVPPAQLLAQVSSAMIVGLLRVYWETQGVSWRLASGAENRYEELLLLDVQTNAEPVAINRLLHEVELLESTHGHVTAFMEDSGSLALMIHASPMVALELAEDFPSTPPLVWLSEDNAETWREIVLSNWSTARPLVEVVNGVIDE